jgi:hypothetical protein
MTLPVSLGHHPSVTEYHVSVQGSDVNSGSAKEPLETISAAAQVAQPGDFIIVHEGTYRERITPPRGGTSDTKRITYRAAKAEKVVIKGSDVVTGWQEIQKGVWKVTLSNTLLGEYNPYKDVIRGDWFNRKGRDHHTGEVYLNGNSLVEVTSLDEITEGNNKTWYCESDDENTYIWASFRDSDPNRELTEINVRPACFYPDAPGRNFITLDGFTMRHAATQWAAPTAEQIGLIGTHWSKGWIIENNVISDSKCVGITLGKDRASGHNDAEGADEYNQVVRRALENGWSREKIGSHIVRNNTIYDCGAAGICGSMGGAFSEVTGNHIYNIHLAKPFSGAEMAGIKLHAPIDTLIKNNYIHHTCLGIWLDWMTQGTRVSANLCHDNGSADLFLEVNHGPYVVDNNILLSEIAVSDWSQGGAFSHNIFAGDIHHKAQIRQTPYHEDHSTEISGLSDIIGGDNRFHNNIFVGHSGLRAYSGFGPPMLADGNVYCSGAVPYQGEIDIISLPGFNPNIRLVQERDGAHLHMNWPRATGDRQNRIVTTDLLGKSRIPNLSYGNPDGTLLKIDSDYFGKSRNMKNPSAGPFEDPGQGKLSLKVWQGKL